MNKELFVLALLKCSNVGTTKILKYIIGNQFSFEKCYENIYTFVPKVEFDQKVKLAEKELRLNESKNIKIITIFDERYPSKLFTISDPVIYLYYSGDINLLNESSVAIIGTRHPSLEAIEATKKISNSLSSRFTIISGLALGIDSIAHCTTVLNGGKTIAVLPSSIDNIYPDVNEKLAKDIVLNGGLLVSEYSSGTPMSKYNYPKRDRIQAALANTIVVAEAKENSGTMITVNKAIKEGKLVYQLAINNNGNILNNLSLEENVFEIIEKAIKENLIKEEAKRKKIEENMFRLEQISLF